MAGKKRTSYYLTKAFYFKVIKIAAIISILAAILVFVRSTEYDKVNDYYLSENIVFSLQYHQDTWDSDPSYFGELLHTSQTPLEYMAGQVFESVPTDVLKNNIGILFVENNEMITPLYFFETKDQHYQYDTNKEYIFANKWIVLCDDPEVLSKVKFYGHNENNAQNSWFDHSNIHIDINWRLSDAYGYTEQMLSKYLPLDAEDDFSQSVVLHASQLISGTSITGDFINNSIELAGVSFAAAGHIIPENTKDTAQSYTIPFNADALTISVEDPLSRLISFNDNLNQLHHLYGLSLANYFSLIKKDDLFISNTIQRISLDFQSSVDTPMLVLWVDSSYDYKELLRKLYQSRVQLHEYQLPDGTPGKELIRNEDEITFDENTFSVGPTTYYFDENNLGDTTRIIVSNTSIEIDNMKEQRVTSTDFMHIPFTLFGTQKAQLSIETKTLFDTLEHTISITYDENTISD